MFSELSTLLQLSVWHCFVTFTYSRDRLFRFEYRILGTIQALGRAYCEGTNLDSPMRLVRTISQATLLRWEKVRVPCDKRRHTLA